MAGRQAGRYKLIRELGAGSIGIVYEAHDRERNAKVALKQLRVLSPAGLRNLRREFRVLQGASHPNIIELHDLVLDETPPFITMELLQGQDLIAYVRARSDALQTRDIASGTPTQAQLPRFAEGVNEERLRAALAQIAQGLHAIHEIGIVHRDLKPSNVMVTTEGRVVVMDFSIAVDARAHAEDTSDDALIGTPYYMAPEQATGAPPTPAADWYALGVVLYQAITKKLPFTGTYTQIVENKQAYDAPSVHELVAEVPEDLATLCAALLARHPHERPSGRDVLFQLGVSAADDAFTHARRLERLPFAGRDPEIAFLQRLLDRALAGEGGCVLLTGPSGMGKTRLVQEFMDRQEAIAPGSLMVFQGRCHPVDQRPHNALHDIVDQLSRALARFPKEKLRDILPTGHELLPRMFPECSRIPGVERVPRVRESNLDALRTRTIDVLRALLQRLASDHGLLLFVDDAQWADRDSVDLLCDMFRVSPPRRVLLIVALRAAQEQDRSADDTLSGHSPARAEQHAVARAQLMTLADNPDGHLELGELRAAARKEILSWMYRDEPPSLDERSSGWPRLLIERARRAFVLAGSDPRARAAEPVISEDSLERLMRLQIRGLSKKERALLEICALIGYPAPLSLLASIVDISATDRSAAMDTLRSLGLVRRGREGREPWLEVGHEAVRSTVLATLDDQRRTDLYQRLAMAVQRSGNASHPELAASWYAARDFERAFSYLELSAKSTRDRFAFHRSAGVYQAALESPTLSRAEIDRLTMARVDMLARAGRHREAAYLIEGVENADASTVDLRVRAADLRLRGGDIKRGTSRLLERVTELVSQDGGPLPEAPQGTFSAFKRRLRISFAQRRHRPRHRDEIAPLDLYQVDTLSSGATCLALLAPEESRRIHTACLVKALGHGERHRVTRAQACELIHGLTNLALDPDEAARQGAELAHQAREVGAPQALALAQLATGLARFWQGRFVPADECFADALDILTWNLPDAHWELLITNYLNAITCIVRGRLRGRGSFIARVLERARRSNDIVGRALFGSIPNMWCAMAMDRVAEALTSLDEVQSALPDEYGAPLQRAIAMARSMGALYARRTDDARRALDAITDARSAKRQAGYFTIEVRAMQARLAALQGDHGALADHAQYLQRRGDDMALGHASMLRAHLADDAGDRAGAVSALDHAVSHFSAAGAAIYAMAARYRLGRIGADTDGEAHGRVAADWCRTQRIANESRMFDYLCPWPSKESVSDAVAEP